MTAGSALSSPLRVSRCNRSAPPRASLTFLPACSSIFCLMTLFSSHLPRAPASILPKYPGRAKRSGRSGSSICRKGPAVITTSGFCRDCLADAPPAQARCGACGSPRLIWHDQLETLAVAHIDCDAFYAAAEKRDDPSLAAEPVIVGGGKRGVVAAACYVARIYGVRSAMPMFQALRLCPHAKVIRPNMDKYVKVGREVRQMMLALSPAGQPVAI